ncbi:unnamed protein product [Spirodela intermedia]|uniref:Uncharacterized protein n=1 Tax=Spirodela intermedia TaxID=51605 RepID=A0A7I8IYR6_SPIIN|nr:unnamed protein product [Spirodela intermedia]CAA6663135.1 unnamed protein product [Spirodela intermedia]
MAASLCHLPLPAVSGGRRRLASGGPEHSAASSPSKTRTGLPQITYQRNSRSGDPSSKANPTDKESTLSGTSDSGSKGGPPLLTIIAGIVVFLLVCWVVGSIALWLVGLIVNLPLPK